MKHFHKSRYYFNISKSKFTIRTLEKVVVKSTTFFIAQVHTYSPYIIFFLEINPKNQLEEISSRNTSMNNANNHPHLY